MAEPAESSSSRGRAPGWLVVAGAWSWRIVALAAATYVVWYAGQKLRVLVLGLLFGLFLSTLLRPIARWLHEHKIPRPVAAFAALLLFVTVLGGIVTGLAFAMKGQLAELGQAFSEGWRRFIEAVASSPLDVTKGDVRHWFEHQLEGIGASAGSMLQKVITGTERVAKILSMLILTVMFAVFFAMDGDRMFDWVVERAPEARRKRLRQMGETCWSTLSAYVRGLTGVAFVDAVLMGIALWIIGVPMVLALMMIMFLGAYIPFVGAIIATGAAALVALAHGGLVDAALVILAGFIVQQIEGHLLHPFIMGHAVSLHPAVVLAVVAGGTLVAGLPGAFLAVPVAAVVHNVFGEGSAG